MSENTKKYYMIDEGDEDCALHVAVCTATGNGITSDRDYNKAVEKADAYFAALTPTSPNYENTEIACLAGN